MNTKNIYKWLQSGPRRQEILLCLHQPMTATHIAGKLRKKQEDCQDAFSELNAHGLVYCINPISRRSRLYWLTAKGEKLQTTLNRAKNLPQIERCFPPVDWELYGWLCYSHRAAIVRALDSTLQPSQIKRAARFQDSTLRMSANNVRDVIRHLQNNGIVTPVHIRGKAHPRYELTKEGKEFQSLLFRISKKDCYASQLK